MQILINKVRNCTCPLSHNFRFSLNINVFTPSLIEGVTGSGKTELYIKIVEKIVSDKGQALIIVPEINLTPQTLNFDIERPC